MVSFCYDTDVRECEAEMPERRVLCLCHFERWLTPQPNQAAQRIGAGVVWVEWGGALLPGPRDSHFPLWAEDHLTDAACRLLLLH